VWDFDQKEYHLTCKFDNYLSSNLIVLANSVGDLYVGSLFAENFDSG
jgi:hypothetical protein